MSDQDQEILDKKVADLRIQAMMFDMDIDWETLEVVPKSKVEPEAIWLTRWKEKVDQSDFEHQANPLDMTVPC